MSNALFEKAREQFLGGGINWTSDTIKISLIDMDDLSQAKLITGATNATPIVITAAGHGYSNGDIVAIYGVLGNTAANGIFKVANVTTNTFELQTRAGANVSGNGAYTLGGRVMNLTAPDNWDDIASAARVATATLASKTKTNGVADAADVTFTAVSGDVCEALIIWKDTGTESTSTLIAFLMNVTGLPVTPNGGDISVTFDSGINRIFML
ncbi:MAG TPA: hypothetical protein VEV81_05510 [Pyrinomonadaceae bacterium]|nr:hypothetical protein [Pyrinomonadaceae bacterium]